MTTDRDSNGRENQPRRAGRPSKLTPALKEGILTAIGKGGCTCADACLKAGISTSTFLLFPQMECVLLYFRSAASGARSCCTRPTFGVTTSARHRIRHGIRYTPRSVHLTSVSNTCVRSCGANAHGNGRRDERAFGTRGIRCR